jgi:hypothetical protein
MYWFRDFYASPTPPSVFLATYLQTRAYTCRHYLHTLPAPARKWTKVSKVIGAGSMLSHGVRDELYTHLAATFERKKISASQFVPDSPGSWSNARFEPDEFSHFS